MLSLFVYMVFVYIMHMGYVIYVPYCIYNVTYIPCTVYVIIYNIYLYLYSILVFVYMVGCSYVAMGWVGIGMGFRVPNGKDDLLNPLKGAIPVRKDISFIMSFVIGG